MTKCKSMLLFLSLLLTLLTVSSTAAANAVVGNGIPGSCTQTAFNNALATVQATGGGTITFLCGRPLETIVFTSPKSIAQNVIIDGDNAVYLTGNNTTRLFDIQAGGTLVLRDIVLTQGYSAFASGGAIYALGSVTLDHATILDSSVGSGFDGGAIANFAPVTLSNGSLLQGNTTQNGRGGAIFAVGEAADVVIDNSTLQQNGDNINSDSGGAVFISNAADLFVINNSLLYKNGRNLGTEGGAIYDNSDGNSLVHIANSEISTNGFASGGGIYSKGVVNVVDSIFRENNALGGFGGAIYSAGGAVFLTNSLLKENAAPTNVGGAYYGLNASLSATNVSFIGNVADHFGGGMWVEGGDATISNATFSGNYVGCNAPNCAGTFFRGSAIYNNGGEVALVNVTLKGNTSYGTASFVYNNLPGGLGFMTLRNVIIDATGQVACGGSPFSISNTSTSSDGTCSQLTGTNNLADTNPGLETSLVSQGGLMEIYRLKSGSLSIDNGICLGVPATDQIGQARPNGATCDRGAVEYYNSCVPASPVLNITVTPSGNTHLLSWTAPANATTYRVWESNNPYFSAGTSCTSGGCSIAGNPNFLLPASPATPASGYWGVESVNNCLDVTAIDRNSVMGRFSFAITPN